MRFGVPELIVVAALIAFAYFVTGRIAAKAGLSQWLGLLTLVPILNVILICWFAFAEWPVLRRRSDQ